MALKEKAKQELARFNARADADKSGGVSATEARQYAEDSIRKRPWRTVAITALLTAVGVMALFALYMITR